MASPAVRDWHRVKSNRRYLACRLRAKRHFSLATECRLGTDSDVDWEGEPATRQSVSGGMILGGGHCLTVWTKKQQVAYLSAAESEFVRCSQIRVGKARDTEREKRPRDSVRANPALGCLRDDGPGQPQRIGS